MKGVRVKDEEKTGEVDEDGSFSPPGPPLMTFPMPSQPTFRTRKGKQRMNFLQSDMKLWQKLKRMDTTDPSAILFAAKAWDEPDFTKSIEERYNQFLNRFGSAIEYDIKTRTLSNADILFSQTLGNKTFEKDSGLLTQADILKSHLPASDETKAPEGNLVTKQSDENKLLQRAFVNFVQLWSDTSKYSVPAKKMLNVVTFLNIDEKDPQPKVVPFSAEAANFEKFYGIPATLEVKHPYTDGGGATEKPLFKFLSAKHLKKIGSLVQERATSKITHTYFFQDPAIASVNLIFSADDENLFISDVDTALEKIPLLESFSKKYLLDWRSNLAGKLLRFLIAGYVKAEGRPEGQIPLKDLQGKIPVNKKLSALRKISRDGACKQFFNSQGNTTFGATSDGSRQSAHFKRYIEENDQIYKVCGAKQGSSSVFRPRLDRHNEKGGINYNELEEANKLLLANQAWKRVDKLVRAVAEGRQIVHKRGAMFLDTRDGTSMTNKPERDKLLTQVKNMMGSTAVADYMLSGTDAQLEERYGKAFSDFEASTNSIIKNLENEADKEEFLGISTQLRDYSIVSSFTAESELNAQKQKLSKYLMDFLTTEDGKLPSKFASSWSKIQETTEIMGQSKIDLFTYAVEHPKTLKENIPKSLGLAINTAVKLLTQLEQQLLIEKVIGFDGSEIKTSDARLVLYDALSQEPMTLVETYGSTDDIKNLVGFKQTESMALHELLEKLMNLIESLKVEWTEQVGTLKDDTLLESVSGKESELDALMNLVVPVSEQYEKISSTVEEAMTKSSRANRKTFQKNRDEKLKGLQTLIAQELNPLRVKGQIDSENLDITKDGFQTVVQCEEAYEALKRTLQIIEVQLKGELIPFLNDTAQGLGIKIDEGEGAGAGTGTRLGTDEKPAGDSDTMVDDDATAGAGADSGVKASAAAPASGVPIQAEEEAEEGKQKGGRIEGARTVREGEGPDADTSEEKAWEEQILSFKKEIDTVNTQIEKLSQERKAKYEPVKDLVNENGTLTGTLTKADIPNNRKKSVNQFLGVLTRLRDLLDQKQSYELQLEAANTQLSRLTAAATATATAAAGASTEGGRSRLTYAFGGRRGASSYYQQAMQREYATLQQKLQAVGVTMDGETFDKVLAQQPGFRQAVSGLSSSQSQSTTPQFKYY